MTTRDPRLEGDPASCHAAAAELRSWCRALRGPDAEGTPQEAVLAGADRLAAALDRFAIELRRAQCDWARATTEPAYPAASREPDRNAALALASRARRRLRLTCADILPERPLR